MSIELRRVTVEIANKTDCQKSMKKKRVAIPDDLAADVLFASDRTCCVCRSEQLKIQIHHIDEDPSNNSFDNLAVICLFCHSDAHTRGAFVRNLSRDLIHLYNTSWREIVKLRLIPSADPTGRLELAFEAYLEADIDCRDLKNHFMSLAPDLPDGGEFKDVWDLMLNCWIPKYTKSTYKQFLPLFRKRSCKLDATF